MSRPRKQLAGSQARIADRHGTFAHLEYGELTAYIRGIEEKRRRGRLRDIQGQFTSDATHLAGILVSMVKQNMLTLSHDLSRTTILYKMNTVGRSTGGGQSGDGGVGSKLLVLGNTGKFVDNPLMHTGLYYDSIGFADSALSLNRKRNLVRQGDRFAQGSRKDFQTVKSNALSKRRTEIVIGVVNGQTPIYPAGSGKMWTMEQIAAFHEYGTVNEPARPIWGPAISEFNALTASGGRLHALFKKTYRACEEFLLGTEGERKLLRARSGGRVGGSMFPSSINKGSLVKSLYDANFTTKGSSAFTRVGFSNGAYQVQRTSLD